MKQETWIPLEQCEDGYLYIISARNARLGVYHEKKYGFIVSRFKFSSNFLDMEFHWDIGRIQPEMERYGTVQPIEKLFKIPEDLWEGLKACEIIEDNKELLKYLNGKMLELKDRIVPVAYRAYNPDWLKDCIWTAEGWVSKKRAEEMTKPKENICYVGQKK